MHRSIRLLAMVGTAGALACSVFGSSLEGYAGGGCPAGLEACGDACVDLNSDAAHCGGCGAPCLEGASCSAGVCSASCSTGQTACGSECVDVQTDDQHCGACDNPCPVGQACSAGQCDTACTAEQTECGGTCVDTKTSVLHCGACDTPCPAGQGCIDGGCQIVCPGGQVECGGLCVDLNNDLDNCGSCGNACSGVEVCANGVCDASCPPGQTECSGVCVDLTSDPGNCGTCGNACGTNEECSSGSCAIACSTLLNQAIADPWGYSWDGLERAAATYTNAEQTCAGIGGRLPTATELYRVSATQSATVGQTIHTNLLWSLVPYDGTQQVRVRLSDGSTGPAALTSSLNYRCVCPPPPRNDFTGHYCNGTPGQGCFALQTEGNRYNLDAQNRAPLHKAGAIWECTFYRAHLASFSTLVEAVTQGAPNGSGSWLHTGEDARYDRGTRIRWTGTGAGFTLPTDGSWSASTNLHSFRCAGTNYDPGANPNAIAGEFVGPTSDYKSETNDTASAAWAATLDACWDRGGHLPQAGELVELIQEGLPNGGNVQVRTADGGGSSGGNFYSQVMLWTGAEPRFGYVYSADVTWAQLSANRVFRCIYYPIDTTYAGPSDTDCSGGCTALTLTGNPAPKIWVDSFDRVPATYLDAVDTCRQSGGHLASMRDLVEAVRHGLPNGSNAWQHTSDTGIGVVSSTYVLRDHVLRWTGADPAFTGVGTTYQSWGTIETARPYRCVWTNELR
jgi:hypothetical protein